MRRHAYSWTIRGVLFLLVVVFCFWGIGTGLFAQVHPVATVAGRRILPDDVAREVEQIRRRLQAEYGPEALGALQGVNLRRQALDNLIDKILVEQEASRLGIEISTATLEKAIASQAVFQTGGRFNFALYQRALRDNGYTPADYEAATREQMLGQLLRSMVTEAVRVSDDESRSAFSRHNEILAMAFIEIASADFYSKINPTLAEVEKYYKQSAESFREPERVKIEFIRYDPLILAGEAKFSDKEIKDYYDQNLETAFSHPTRVRAHHILIRLPRDTTPEEVAAARAKAEDILRQLKAGADFTKLATQYSDDVATKGKGGDLGFFGRGELIKPFEEAAFKLKAGEMTVVRTQFGFHVIRVDEVKPAHIDTLAEARPKIVAALREKRGGELVREAVEQDLTAALIGKLLDELAKKRALEAVQSAFFSKDERILGTGDNPNLVSEAFKLKVGEVHAVAGPTPYLIKLLARKPSRIPPLAEIKRQVREALIDSLAEDQARKQAQALLKQIKTPADFDKVARANKLEIRTTGDFPRSGNVVPGIGEFPEVTEVAGYIATLPGVIDQVMENGGNAYILELMSRKPPTDAQWKKDGPDFERQMLETARTQAWVGFLNALKDRTDVTVDANLLGSS